MFTSDHIDHLIDAARRDGENTAMLIAINVVDAFLERAEDLDEFASKWHIAKGVWETSVGEDLSALARTIGEESARALGDALAVFQEWRP